MKIDVIGDELDPEAKLLLKEIKRRGHKGEFVDPRDISYKFTDKIELFLKNKKYQIPKKAIARSGFTRGLQSAGRVFLLTLDSLKVKVIDSPISVLTRQEKTITTALLTSKKVPVPKTLFLVNKKAAKAIDFSPIVVKPVAGRRGQGVYKVDKPSKIKEFPCYVQEYIKHPGRDFRVFCIGNKTLGVICRQALKKGEWRSNVALGAEAKQVPLTNKMKSLAQKARKVVGLEICGIDLLEKGNNYVVLEANRAPQFRGFMRGTGINVPKEIISYIIKA